MKLKSHNVWLGWLGLVLTLLLSNVALGAATLEDRDFTAARKVFEDKNFLLAEKWFGDYARLYTNATRLPEAVLRQAQARLFLTNASGAAQLLAANLPRAGTLADGYLFWLGEAQFQASNFVAAAEAYGRVASEFPASTNTLTASYNEALARHKLGDAPRVTELLSRADGAFQRAAQTRPKDELVASGNLLLGETLLEQKKYREAGVTLDALAQNKLNVEMEWRRQFLQCRLQLADGRASLALQNTTNLLTAASASGQSKFLAESYVLRGGILEKLNDLAGAVQAWTNNLAAPLPTYRRQALLKSIELTLAQGQVTNTIAMLEAFSTQYPSDGAQDVAQLTLGELRLRAYYATTNAPISSTNLLLEAVTNFTRVITDFTNSAQSATAFLQRGWCHSHLGNPLESLADFNEATRRLPVSEAQAIALFKLAEAQAQQGGETNAITNFRLLLERYSGNAQVKSALLNQALYQLLRVGLSVTNLTVAGEAVGKMQTQNPPSEFADRGLLLYGEALDRQGRAVEARTQFEQILQRHPNSALVPEAHLAIARTFKQQRQWGAAIAKLDEWMVQNPTNALLPKAEFERAWVHFQAGNETNALRLWTNFIARFPTHELAPRAQYSVGSIYHNMGEFVRAEENFQLLFQNTNWPGGELKYLARLAAGQAAVERLELKAAVDYFFTIINDTNCPPIISGEAYFQLGQTYLRSREVNEGLTKDPYGDAITAFSRLVNTNTFPNHPLAAQAFLWMGNCHSQQAVALKDATRYDRAGEAYQRVLELPGTEVATRSLAEIGLGQVCEKQSKFTEAATHYAAVVYGKNLRAGESYDPESLKQAGFKAAQLMEDQQQWPEAIKLYQRLALKLPALRLILEKKINQARQQQTTAKN